MKCKIKRLHIVLACFLLLAVLAVGMISPAFIPITARAASGTEYSDVLMDLRKDPEFKASDYPIVAGNYTVNVIQVAESVNGELFVYVYQPNVSGITVTSINMATKPNDFQAGDIKNYKLKLLSVSGALAKYVVRDFKVGSAAIRYYNIISAFRRWVSGVDPASDNGNDIYEVSYEVGKCYVVETESGKIGYSCFETETIMVTDKYVGYIRYPNGHYLFTAYSSLDSYYVAFDTDKRMDKLMEADISFVFKRESKQYFLWWEVEHSVNQTGEMEVTLTSDDAGVSEKNDTFPYYGGNTYHWKRIESVQSFLADPDNSLTNEAKANLANKQWVLRFAEFDYKAFNNLASTEFNTVVEQVTILRLTFETDGKVYNLGVVDNKQAPAPDAPPDNVQENPSDGMPALSWFSNFWDSIVRFFKGGSKWWVYVIVIVLVLILLPMILGFAIPAVGKFLFSLLKSIGKCLWWLISAPFKALAWLFKAIFGKD